MELRVNSVPASLAERLRDAREAVSLSQAELAERLGVSTRTLQYWEAGNMPRPKNRREVFDFIAFVEGELVP